MWCLKSRVIPAEYARAGIQDNQDNLDSRLRGNDE